MIPFLYSFFRTRYNQYRFTSRAQLEKWQDRQVRDIIQYAMKHSPFYAKQFKSHNLNEWRSLPLCDKELMMEIFDQFNTVGIKKANAFDVALSAETSRDFSGHIQDITIGLSSGTSGNRGLFLVSAAERSRWAGAILAKVLPSTLLKKQRIALFLRANSSLYTTVQSRRVQFTYFDLSEPVEELSATLTSFDPTILVAPPSMLRILAKLEAKIQPTKIISVAEVLDPLDEAYIEAHFNQKVHQIYQCTEGFLASTCSHGTIHLNEDLVVIEKEYIDKKEGKFIPIITDMNRYSQPIIRYRLNDILTESREPCPCGSIFTPLESIEGRCDDMFYGISTQDPNLLTPIFPDYIRRAIITTSPLIKEYKAIQEKPNLIRIYLRSDQRSQKELFLKVEKALQALFQRHQCLVPVVQIDKEQHTRHATEKLRRVRRTFKP